MAMAEEAQQTTPLKFSEELAEFEAVAAKTDVGLQVCKDIAEFFRSRAKIEEEYAKKLAALYKTRPGVSMFSKDPAINKESKTLRESMLAILEKGTKMSEVHQQFANKINNEVCKALDTFVKTKSNDRSKIVAEAQKLSKTANDAKANALKAKTEYEKIMKQLDTAIDALKKAEKDESGAPDNKKFQAATKKAKQTVDQLKEKAKALDTAYKNSVSKANDEAKAYRDEKLPSVLDKWEEERWNVLLNSVKTFKAFQEAVPAGLTEQIQELNDAIEAASIEEDFREFVAATKKEAKEEALEYVPYKSKHEDLQAEAAPPKTEEQPKKEEPVAAEEPKKETEEEQPKEEQPQQEQEKPAADLFASSAEDEIFK